MANSHQMEWTFRDGKKFRAGAPRSEAGVEPAKVKESVSSNGLTKYLTILWEDGVLSCDCRGWAILKKDHKGIPKPRTCRHCKESEACDHADMSPVDGFVPAPQVKSKQLDFGERQPRRIRICNAEDD